MIVVGRVDVGVDGGVDIRREGSECRVREGVSEECVVQGGRVGQWDNGKRRGMGKEERLQVY